MQKTYENVHALALDLRVPAGRIAVEAGDVDRVELELEPRTEAASELLDRVTIDFRRRGDDNELVVDVPDRRGFGWFGRGPEFDLRISCPAGGRVNVRSGSADFEATGTLGSLELKTASGDVEIERVEGQVKAVTASGDVGIGAAAGPVEVNTASGDVELGIVERAVRVNVVSGDVTVREPGESVKVNSVSGDQRVEAVARGAVELHSVSGDIEVAVRRGVDVWLDVRSVSGDMRSELTPTEGPSGEAAELVELRVKSVSGDVRVAQAQPAT